MDRQRRLARPFHPIFMQLMWHTLRPGQYFATGPQSIVTAGFLHRVRPRTKRFTGSTRRYLFEEPRAFHVTIVAARCFVVELAQRLPSCVTSLSRSRTISICEIAFRSRVRRGSDVMLMNGLRCFLVGAAIRHLTHISKGLRYSQLCRSADPAALI